MARFTLPRTKTPNERFRISLDFKNDVKVGDSVQSHVATAKRLDTGADVTGTFLANVVRSGTIVEAAVLDGVVDVDYEVKFQVTTVAADVFEGHVVVSVRS